MIKSYAFIGLIVGLIATVYAQQASVTLPDGISIPTDVSIPPEVAAAASSIINNPSAAQSYIAQASSLADALPSEYRASAKSAIAEASKTLAAVQPNTTGSGSSSSAIHLSPNPISYVLGALSITALFAFMV
ncbi:hypothetical protein BDF20DRAFT_903057 [Mycotypha africana]|uniref:uncharacterized protein n=1 Tax=Mycotypha africana TaxID=64632 RepID=UPI00230164CA|nr:uncharacterized protein BDF20DRAFT_903057 [Mycotypha africana]KAI8967035.1 hypothetical protein BDF20DRAFT_903057 [Mycotypha africana]